MKTEETEEGDNNPCKIANRVADYKVRQITINKNPFFDYTAGLLQSEQLKFKSGPYDLQVLNHILDMRRIRDHRYAEMRYRWVKSKKGADHFFRAINYGVAAFKLIDTISTASILPRVLLHKVKLQKQV